MEVFPGAQAFLVPFVAGQKEQWKDCIPFCNDQRKGNQRAKEEK
jgi:hypothetical protein